MSNDATNLGIAQVKVEILPSLPEINTNPVRSNFDITALAWPMIKNSPLMAPLLTDSAKDELDTFGVLFPSKRKFFVDNYLAGGNAIKTADKSKPHITWTPTSTIEEGSVLNEFLKDFSKTPYNPNASMTDATYDGPRWIDIQQNYIPPSDDASLIESFNKWVKGLSESGGDDDKDKDEEEKILPSMNVVCQTTTKDGLWWGIESSSFITEHMPFWVNISKDNSPTTFNKETIIVVSMGLTSNENKFDIILSANNKPRVVDYTLGGVQKEWDADTSRVLSEEKNIEIGVMVAAGRLMVFVNKEVLIYTRIDKDNSGKDDGGKIFNSKIEAGKIRVYGTNIIATVNACPMVFAPQSYFALAIPTTDQLSGKNSKLKWAGVDKKGDPSGSVAELPKSTDDGKKIFGVDCKKFSGDGGSCSPSGPTYQKKGEISFKSAGKAGFNGLPSVNFFVVSMRPQDGKMNSAGGSVVLPNGGCPYFFRLKGIAVAPDKGTGSGGTDISNLVISASESATAPDYFHVKRGATVVAYNENGLLSSLTKGQKGIRISWGWGDASRQSFTGLITSYNVSEKAGMETITLNCEDYMFILKNSLIVNSPFYDGMLARAAIVDLAKRGGCESPKYKWANENEYFLPSGYSFTQPQVRFPPTNSIFDCIMDLAKRFEAYFYFDEKGVFNLEKLPGGLFSAPTNIKGNFVQDPATSDKSDLILGEKNVTYDYNSTINVISVITLERDTRNYVTYSDAAPQSKILFRRVKLMDQPALGELAVARAWAKEFGKRAYKAILKTTFKTIGETKKDVFPLDFVNVCGQPFRVMSLKRSFNADNNDFTHEYECEWLGG